MILTCPECATSYFVDDARIPANGRVVKCMSCDARWTAMPEGAPEPARQAPRGPSKSFQAGDAVDDLVVVAPADQSAPGPVSQPVTRRASPAAGREAGGKVAIWLGAALFVALTVAAAFFFRGAVVRYFPSAQAAYAGVGLPVDALGLAIEDIRAQPTFEDGRPILAVSGAVRNERDVPAVMPSLRVSLLDQAGNPVAEKLAQPANPSIPGRATRHFAVTLIDPPADGRDLQITFESPFAGPGPAKVPAPARPAIQKPVPETAKPPPAGSPAPAPSHG
jgi:predicted Zn finger-like uncharacterized protein